MYEKIRRDVLPKALKIVFGFISDVVCHDPTAKTSLDTEIKRGGGRIGEVGGDTSFDICQLSCAIYCVLRE